MPDVNILVYARTGKSHLVTNATPRGLWVAPRDPSHPRFRNSLWGGQCRPQAGFQPAEAA